MAILQLVSADSKPPQQRPRAEMQLRLPFDGSDIGFVAMDVIHGTQFEHILITRRPPIVADLRYAPRFEIIGTSSVRVYSLLQQIGANYSRFPIPFHVIERDFLRHDFAGTCREVIKSCLLVEKVIEGPILVLLHSEDHARLFAPYLCNALTEATRVNWRQSF